ILGAAGLAVGLAFQGTFSNFASGVMLLLFRPISVGDFVEVGGSTGTVRSIGIFSTSMDTPDNVRVILPSSAVFGETIQNFSVNENRRIDLVVGVGYDDDLQRAKDTILRVLKDEERVLPDPEPVVAVSQMADSSVNFVVRPWVRAQDYWATRWDLTRALKEELEAAGLSIPYPQRDLHLFSGGDALRIPARS
ncbi:MAG TPA: mechanosensitive ion channel domain-containing protein, partial [Longimicrobiales bacterium]|nr:mechanosensitive ion channel domain-containing protein [Longimicrobiales bacterium]